MELGALGLIREGFFGANIFYSRMQKSGLDFQNSSLPIFQQGQTISNSRGHLYLAQDPLAKCFTEF